MASYSTKRAAKKVGISYITLRRWLADGKFTPSVAVPTDAGHFYRFNDSDIKRLRAFKAAHYGKDTRQKTQ